MAREAGVKRLRCNFCEVVGSYEVHGRRLQQRLAKNQNTGEIRMVGKVKAGLAFAALAAAFALRAPLRAQDSAPQDKTQSDTMKQDSMKQDDKMKEDKMSTDKKKRSKDKKRMDEKLGHKMDDKKDHKMEDKKNPS
ncbi:MAG: hypothetical protein DMG38_15625 [Acidobacteria bacterium]|nr:MAG: hypothetical protein DMG38_15625 [Acidobacteriota bacterium]